MDREELLKKQFVREARIGIALIGITFALFVAIAYTKLSRSTSPVDDNLAAQEPAQESQIPFAAQQAQSAIQTQLNAATVSVLSHVETQVGDTSPTKSPPMPAPRAFLAPVDPALDSRETIVPASDSSFQKNDSQQATVFASPNALDGNQSLSDNTAEPTPRIAPHTFDSPSPSASQRLPLAPIQNSTSQFPIRRASTSEADAASLPNLSDSAAPTNLQTEDHPPIISSDSTSEPAEEFSPEDPSALKLADNTAAPKVAEDALVEFKAGESLWTLAQRHYGDGRLFRAIAAYNQLDESPSGRPEADGMLRLPPLSTLQAAFPQLVPKPSAAKRSDGSLHAAAKTYFTQPGDTLFDIARDHLGQASRYVELISLNANVLPANATASGKLPSGIRLRLAKE